MPAAADCGHVRCRSPAARHRPADVDLAGSQRRRRGSRERGRAGPPDAVCVAAETDEDRTLLGDELPGWGILDQSHGLAIELVGLDDEGAHIALDGDEDEDDEYEKKVMTIAHRELCIGCTACAKICPKKCYTHAAASI